MVIRLGTGKIIVNGIGNDEIRINFECMQLFWAQLIIWLKDCKISCKCHALYSFQLFFIACQAPVAENITLIWVPNIDSVSVVKGVFMHC